MIPQRFHQAQARASATAADPIKPDPLPDIPDPAIVTYAQALKGITNLDFCLSAKFTDQQMRADRFGAHLEILEFERVFVMRLKKLGVPMFAHCVMRDRAKQDVAYVQGHSHARWGQSPHNFGCAVDLIHGIHGWEIPRKSWEVLGHMGHEIANSIGVKIRWGGDFARLWDPAHWELENWRSRKHEIS